MLNSPKSPFKHWAKIILVLFPLSIYFLSLWSCASIRSPSGGPKDTIPPFVLGSIPKNYTRNFKGQNITILFDEFIKIKDASTSIQISPEMEKPPIIKVVKKSIQINFQSPLEKNRTYTINFGNSILDYNEGNILKNYRYVLSTGPFLDSLKISGTVSDPLDTSAKKDIYVILHPAGNDSAIIKKKPFLYTTTDEKGNFILENLPSGPYNIYALLESNKNKKYDSKSESIAFIDHPIQLHKDTANIKLNLFKESDTSVQTLKKTLRDGLFKIFFNLSPDSLEIEPIKHPNESEYILEKHGNGDTAYVWIPDPKQDSLSIKVYYRKKKPLLVSQQNFNKPKKIAAFSTEDNIEQNYITPDKPLEITFSRPVRNLNPENITIIEDSLNSNLDSVVAKDKSYRHYYLFYSWQPKRKYRLELKPGKINDIYQATNQGYQHNFQLGQERNYGTINLKLIVPSEGNYLVELLDEKFKVLKINTITNSTTINYRYVNPGKYRIRVIYDRNKNGHYDTGILMKKIQPEKIITSKELIIRANFELNPSFPLPKAD